MGHTIRGTEKRVIIQINWSAGLTVTSIYFGNLKTRKIDYYRHRKRSISLSICRANRRISKWTIILVTDCWEYNQK